MLELLLFFFCSFFLFFLIKVELLRYKFLPKFYLELEERVAENLKRVLDSPFALLLALALLFLIVFLVVLESNIRPWFSIWVVVFGLLYSLVKRVNFDFFKKIISGMYFLSLKSTFIPSYIIYRLAIIKLALLVTELFTFELVSILGSRGGLLAMGILGTTMPVANLNVIGEMLVSFTKVAHLTEKIGFSRIISEIATPENKLRRDEIAYHLAKYTVKGHKQLLVDENYLFKPVFVEPHLKHINFVKVPGKETIKEFVKLTSLVEWQNALLEGRKAISKKECIAFFHIIKGQEYKASQGINKIILEIKQSNFEIIKEVESLRAQLKYDAANFAIILPIMESLPTEALGVNTKGLEDLSCVSEHEKTSVKSIEMRALKNPKAVEILTIDDLEILLTETSVLKYALPYFRSLGELERIVRSTNADYTLIYKDGRVLDIECKYASPENVTVKNVEKKGTNLFRAWYNTMTREFKVCKVLGEQNYRQLYKLNFVKEVRGVSGNVKMIQTK